jgi:hypothetical protein
VWWCQTQRHETFNVAVLDTTTREKVAVSDTTIRATTREKAAVSDTTIRATTREKVARFAQKDMSGDSVYQI